MTGALNEKLYFTIKEAAAVLHVSPKTIQRLIKRGSLKTFRVGARHRIPRKGILRNA